jgi:hypothetical protein
MDRLHRSEHQKYSKLSVSASGMSNLEEQTADVE